MLRRSRSMVSQFSVVMLCIAMLNAIACGSKDEDQDKEEETESRGVVRVVGSGAGETRMVDVPVIMQTSSSDTGGFGLVSTPTYVVSLEGCISGYTASTTDLNPNLKVYRYDRGCKAKLSELVIDGRTLVPTSTNPFTTWDAGDEATFDEVGEAGIYTVEVVVIAQLSDPVTGAETIEYQIRDLLGGGDHTSYVPPISLSGVTCCTTNALKANGVELTLTWSPLTSRYDHVTVRRVAGGTPPAAVDCSSDTLVTTFSSFVPEDIILYTDDTGNPGQAYSYRACVFDAGSQVIETATISNVSSANIQWMFATSSSFASGGFGTAAAVSTCQTLGDTIDNTLTWTALLSDATMEAPGRLPISGTVYNRNATPEVVATTYAAFWGGSLTTAGRFTETGGASTSSAWTGTLNGGYRSPSNCNNWTDSTNSYDGIRGTVNSTSLYLNAGTTACNSGTRVGFCLSHAIKPLTAFSAAKPGSGSDGDVALTVTFPANTTGYTQLDIRRSLGANDPDGTCATGTLVKSYTGTFTSEVYTDATGKPGAYFRYAACLYSGATLISRVTTYTAARAYGTATSHTIFVTSDTSQKGSQGGFTGMDAVCQLAGDKLGAGRTWRAVASTSTVTANSAGRIAGTANIRNVNGDLVANNAADLFDGTIGSAVQYTELGTDAGAAQVWTGANTTGGSAADTCTDWTSSAGGKRATYGIANATGGTWLSNTAVACSATKSFYCYSTTAD